MDNLKPFGISPIIILITIIIILIATTAIGNFFEISFADYEPYITWLIAIGLFSFLLKRKDIFNSDNK